MPLYDALAKISPLTMLGGLGAAFVLFFFIKRDARSIKIFLYAAAAVFIVWMFKHKYPYNYTASIFTTIVFLSFLASLPKIMKYLITNPPIQVNNAQTTIFNTGTQQTFNQPFNVPIPPPSFRTLPLTPIIGVWHGTPDINNAHSIGRYGWIPGPRKAIGTGIYFADYNTSLPYAKNKGAMIKATINIMPHEIVHIDDLYLGGNKPGGDTITRDALAKGYKVVTDGTMHVVLARQTGRPQMIPHIQIEGTYKP